MIHQVIILILSIVLMFIFFSMFVTSNNLWVLIQHSNHKNWSLMRICLFKPHLLEKNLFLKLNFWNVSTYKNSKLNGWIELYMLPLGGKSMHLKSSFLYFNLLLQKSNVLKIGSQLWAYPDEPILKIIFDSFKGRISRNPVILGLGTCGNIWQSGSLRSQLYKGK